MRNTSGNISFPLALPQLSLSSTSITLPNSSNIVVPSEIVVHPIDICIVFMEDVITCDEVPEHNAEFNY